MKYLIYNILALIIFTGCSGDDTSFDNPNLIEPGFSYTINLNLPQYASLSNPGTAVYVNNSNVGIRGVFVFNTGSGSYVAWEASCPNHRPNDCSTMQLVDGVFCECSCEDYKYELAGGALVTEFKGEGRAYTLQPYRVTTNNNIIKISN
ncbi:hypothetical protein HX109_07470 [Galbibacter sp. BG1]|uniref:hypothetical protein n=1 Tax=Galbibacter sp. BG1 TaxID=1170699 RepID=UPI0015BB7920|nr:hypothetical protein [Galbibacter sp. BG1]QLE01409.1 hypothetical protein HX109_07470 [Galbibacter sp. BG1]